MSELNIPMIFGFYTDIIKYNIIEKTKNKKNIQKFKFFIYFNA